jgi:hypothetical protein
MGDAYDFQHEPGWAQRELKARQAANTARKNLKKIPSSARKVAAKVTAGIPLEKVEKGIEPYSPRVVYQTAGKRLILVSDHKPMTIEIYEGRDAFDNDIWLPGGKVESFVDKAYKALLKQWENALID